MEKRKLGNSGIMVTPIAFGAWAIGGWMWGGADKKEAIGAIEASINDGISTIDTAPVYGFGLSEKIVGEAIRGKRDKTEILTKYGLRWDSTRGEYYFSSEDNQGNAIKLYKNSAKESVIFECEQSLKRLGTDYIDLYQIHWPDSTTPVDETMEAIAKLLEQGKIRSAGVCNYDKNLLTQGLKKVDIVSDQVPYSMVRRDIEDILVPYCIRESISILAYSPLQRGLLTGKFKPGHKFNKGDTRPDTTFFKEGNLQKINDMLKKIEPIAKEKNSSLAQLVLRWTIEQPGITCVLAGARNEVQVRENTGALQINLKRDEIDFINSLLDELKLDR